jgi:hypothetical protein
VQGSKKSSSLLVLIDKLIDHPVITIGIASQVLDVTFMGAKWNIERLVSMGILQEVTGQPRNKRFVAQGVIDAIS